MGAGPRGTPYAAGSPAAPRAGSRPCVLTVAGSDPSGGAGLQMDVRVIGRLGGHPACAVTAVTVQDSRAVRAVHVLPPELVTAQMEAAAGDLPVLAVKTGMLGDARVARAVAACLRALGLGTVVVDPVLAAGTGEPLWTAAGTGPGSREAVPAAAAGLEAWLDLLSLAEVVTPNVPEAAALLGWEPERLRTEADLEAAARSLRRLGPRWVCVTGGHLPSPDVVADVLTDGRDTWTERRRRLPLAAPHGAGCAFSAALATGLARGLTVPAAFRLAGSYAAAALAGALPLGRGRPFADPEVEPPPGAPGVRDEDSRGGRGAAHRGEGRGPWRA